MSPLQNRAIEAIIEALETHAPIEGITFGPKTRFNAGTIKSLVKRGYVRIVTAKNWKTNWPNRTHPLVYAAPTHKLIEEFMGDDDSSASETCERCDAPCDEAICDVCFVSMVGNGKTLAVADDADDADDTAERARIDVEYEQIVGYRPFEDDPKMSTSRGSSLLEEVKRDFPIWEREARARESSPIVEITAKSVVALDLEITTDLPKTRHVLYLPTQHAMNTMGRPASALPPKKAPIFGSRRASTQGELFDDLFLS